MSERINLRQLLTESAESDAVIDPERRIALLAAVERDVDRRLGRAGAKFVAAIGLSFGIFAIARPRLPPDTHPGDLVFNVAMGVAVFAGFMVLLPRVMARKRRQGKPSLTAKVREAGVMEAYAGVFLLLSLPLASAPWWWESLAGAPLVDLDLWVALVPGGFGILLLTAWALSLWIARWIDPDWWD